MVWRNKRVWSCASIVAACWLISVNGAAARINLAPPETGGYILDGAGLIIEKDEEAIRSLCKGLRAEQSIPLVVVTIDSMASVDRSRDTIEIFARGLFNRWGRDINFEFRDSWRRGILLLISKNDRKARIELGADWAGQYNEQCQRVMDQLIIPKFKEDRYSAGIIAGVSGLEAMSRGEELPKWTFEDIKAPLGAAALIGGFFILLFIDFRPGAKPGRSRDGGYHNEDDYSTSSWDSGSDFGGGGGATGSW